MTHKVIFARAASLRVMILVACSLATQAAQTQADQQAVDFERHVAPLLGRLGCNTAACHGAFGGRGGLQLSLFGYSPQLDFENLGDFIDSEDAGESLVLQKPTGKEDHEGGVRFDVDSRTYKTIRRWIEAGELPTDNVRLGFVVRCVASLEQVVA